MIRLTRSVVVSSFDAEATVGIGRDRPEFLAIARLAADLARPIGPQDVLRELLGVRHEVLGRRVIQRCVDLGLLERSGSKNEDATLSEAGRRALEHGEVLVREEGIWRFYVIDDPLVPAALVHARRLEAEPVRKERAALKARPRGDSRPQVDRVPELLRRCRGTSPHESVQNGNLFQLAELTETGAAGPSGDLQLVFDWSAEPSLRLTGRLPVDSRDANPKPIDAGVPLPDFVARLSRGHLWRLLVTSATQVSDRELLRWEAIAGGPAVPVAFSSLPAAARHSFRRDIEVPAPNPGRMGRFDDTVLKEVELVPASHSDAQAWLEWLQWEAIDDYVTPAVLDDQGRKQRSRFPHYNPRALSASDLLDRARSERDERAWFILGPSDLGLWS